MYTHIPTFLYPYVCVYVYMYVCVDAGVYTGISGCNPALQGSF